jgi:hypothetical protein
MLTVHPEAIMDLQPTLRTFFTFFDVFIFLPLQLFPPDDERLSLETCRGRKINTSKKVKKVRQVGCKSRIFSLPLDILSIPYKGAVSGSGYTGCVTCARFGCTTP